MVSDNEKWIIGKPGFPQKQKNQEGAVGLKVRLSTYSTVSSVSVHMTQVLIDLLREGCKKSFRKVWSFTKPGSSKYQNQIPLMRAKNIDRKVLHPSTSLSFKFTMVLWISIVKLLPIPAQAPLCRSWFQNNHLLQR